jgi:hypothetical protein
VAAADTPSVFQVEPRVAAPVTVAAQAWSIQPSARVRRYQDLYGNQCVR